MNAPQFVTFTDGRCFPVRRIDCAVPDAGGWTLYVRDVQPPGRVRLEDWPPRADVVMRARPGEVARAPDGSIQPVAFWRVHGSLASPIFREPNP